LFYVKLQSRHYLAPAELSNLRPGLSVAGLELMVFLPPHPKCWDYRYAPPHQAYDWFLLNNISRT
jgi:hypothetical protein